MVDNAIKTGRRTKGNKPGRVKHIGRKIWVVTENNGKTVVSGGWNMSRGLKVR